MRPVLFSILDFDVQAYGVSKAAAALLGAFLLGRAFHRQGLERDDAHSLVIWATIWGFVSAKVYFLLEHADEFTWHHLGGAGFTWYGGLIGGTAAFLVIIRRRRLPARAVADAAAIPLALAYGVGRIGCWLSGDGTYGKPTDLPWGETFAQGMVASDVPVHPTPLYEALAAVAIAGALWALKRRARPELELFGAYLILSGVSRLAVEYLRINEPALLGLTQPQLWSILIVVIGVAIIVSGRRRRRIEPNGRPWRDSPDWRVSDPVEVRHPAGVEFSTTHDIHKSGAGALRESTSQRARVRNWGQSRNNPLGAALGFCKAHGQASRELAFAAAGNRSKSNRGHLQWT